MAQIDGREQIKSETITISDLGCLSTDGSFSGVSNSTVSSSLATKTYIDNNKDSVTHFLRYCN